MGGRYRLGEGLARRFRPAAVFRDRSLALLAGAALPGTGRDAAFRLGSEPERAGYPVRDITGEVVGHLQLFTLGRSPAMMAAIRGSPRPSTARPCFSQASKIAKGRTQAEMKTVRRSLCMPTSVTHGVYVSGESDG